MTDKHTTGKWEWVLDANNNYLRIESDKGESILDIFAEFCDTADLDIKPADARRLVACVNACRGITTEKLEELGNGMLNEVLYKILTGEVKAHVGGMDISVPDGCGATVESKSITPGCVLHPTVGVLVNTYSNGRGVQRRTCRCMQCGRVTYEFTTDPK